MRQRHPVGLYVLFFTEMWERFGFYCMLAVFRFYLKASQYEFLRENADQIWGLYLGGVYFTPFFGGILADRWLGYRRSIVLGAIALAAGYGLLSLEPAITFGLGLTLIIVGNGLFKPNISSMVGKLYAPGDPRIDNAFTIFYMGINVGALTSPIAAAAIGNLMGGEGKAPEYLAAFAVASVGMIISLLIFAAFQSRVVEVGARSDGSGQVVEVSRALQVRRNMALAIFFTINVLFWMAFKQNGNTLALWAQERTDRTPPEWLVKAFSAVRLDWVLFNKDGQMAPALFAAINPFFVIALSPLLVWVWGALRSIGREVPTPAKLVIGFALTTAAFALMWQVARTTDGLASPLALVAVYSILTIGELCLCPMGLSLVSKLSDPRTRSMWMGGFFVSTAVGGYLSGGLRALVKDWPFADFFLLLTGSSAVAMLLMLAAYPLIASALRPTLAKKT